MSHKINTQEVLRSELSRAVPTDGPLASQCQIWPRSKSKDQYGQISVSNRLVFAHRLAWEIAHGPIPKGLCVLHKCDTPACVNPEHLFVGTKSDNSRDMTGKGRNGAHAKPERVPRGEQHGGAKLNDATVISIRARYAAGGVTQQALAKEVGVVRSVVDSIIRRKIWTHI